MNDRQIHSLFVYGSLRSGFNGHAHQYVSHFFSFVGNAKVKGKLFDLGNYPAAVPASDEYFVIGELYTIKHASEFPWAIGQLDDYEGVSVEPDEIQLYKRELVSVFINDTAVTAWIYWYNGNVEGRPLIESGDLIQYLEQKNNTSAAAHQ